MKRYSVGGPEVGNSERERPDPEGNLVLYADHQRKVQKLQREIADLRAAYDMPDVDCDGCGGSGRITFLGEDGKCPRCHGSGKLVGP